MNSARKIYDVVVIGGGPAGMMAAGRAAERGARVLLLEKNGSLGKKLLITGGGRCNLTNAEFDARKFLSKFGSNGKFLFSSFAQFNVEQTLEFFHSHRLNTKIEAEKRVFPASNSAQSVLNALTGYLRAGNVAVRSNSEVANIARKDTLIESVNLKNGEKIFGASFVLATGGKSHPETGSTGDGFIWLKKLGHTVIDPKSALVPVAVKDAWVKKLQGLSLPDVKLTIIQNKKISQAITGKILFTHFGLSGPATLNASQNIGELLRYGEVTLSLDLFPKLSPEKLNLALQDIFKKESNKKCKNSLANLIPARLQLAVINSAGISPDTFCHSITRAERIRLADKLKNMTMTASKLLSAEKAIVTSGGVSLLEIDFKTMGSRIYNNLYCVGDILNIDRPSGGYSLQLCWTTGYVAGSNITLRETALAN